MRRSVLLLLVLAAASAGEISLRRTACYGSCPDDEVVLRADGSARFRGMRNAERVGDYRGRVTGYAALLASLRRLGFATLASRYYRPNIDSPDVIVSVNGRTVTSHQTDEPLRPYIAAIREVAARVAWTPVPSGIEGTLRERLIIRRDGRTYYVRGSPDATFRIPLEPGTYELLFGWPGAITERTTITVVEDRYARVDRVRSSRKRSSPR